MLLSLCMNGQVTHEAFLGGLPGIPGSVCSTADSEIDLFLDQIALVRGQIKDYSDKLSNIASGRKEEMTKLANMSEEEQEKWGQEYAASKFMNVMLNTAGRCLRFNWTS